MAKKLRKRMMGQPIAYEPDPKAMHRMAAEHMADTAMRTHPAMRKVRNAIVEEVERAATRAVGKTRRA